MMIVQPYSKVFDISTWQFEVSFNQTPGKPEDRTRLESIFSLWARTPFFIPAKLPGERTEKFCDQNLSSPLAAPTESFRKIKRPARSKDARRIWSLAPAK